MFATKFNNINIDDFDLNNIDINTLVSIHHYLFNELWDNAGKIREDDKETLENINHILKYISNLNFNVLSENEIAYLMCNTISKIYLAQIFYNGNARTTVTFLKLFLISKGIRFNYSIAIDNKHNYKKFISLLYNYTDNISMSSLEHFKKFIKIKY